MNKTICVANQKGGSGKTATVAALAHAAVKDGKTVLAVDLDPQGNLSYTLDADPRGGNAYELLEGKLTAADVIRHTKSGVDAIPAGWSLQSITAGAGSAWRLSKALEPVKKSYDLIVIDTPPTPGELQYNALLASTGLIIPMQAELYNLQGSLQMIDTVDHLLELNDGDLELDILGVLFTRYETRSNISKQMSDLARKNCEELDIPVIGVIHEAVPVKEAAALRRSLYDHAPKSRPAQDYWQLYQKIMNVGGGTEYEQI